MFTAIVKDNLGKTVASAPCCMTLKQAQDFADSSAINYRRDNPVVTGNRKQYRYCSIVITSGTSRWWKWYPTSSILNYSECGM